MFDKGDHVICRGGGVWRVEDIDQDAVTLSEHEGGTIKRISVLGGEIVRKIIGKEQMLEVVDRIGFIRTLQAPDDKYRNELYLQAMSKFDELEWVRVIKTAYIRSQEGPLGSPEAELAGMAKNFLHGEISVLMGIPVDQVEQYIRDSLVQGW